MLPKAKRFYDLIQIVTIFFREPSEDRVVSPRPPPRTKKLPVRELFSDSEGSP
jgi:hypothetical protein